MMLENIHSQRLSLDGTWQIEIGDQSGAITVPGVWETQGYPHDAVTALYTRSVELPSDWVGARVFLRFEAVSYRVEVSVNGQIVGTHDGMWTPFEFDVTGVVHAGATNTITLTVTKPGGEGSPFPYRDVLVGFVPYVARTFGGLWQTVTLIAQRAPAFRMGNIQADWRTGEVRASAALDYFGEQPAKPDRWQVDVLDANGVPVASLEAASDEFTLTVPHPALWSPETPTLYDLRLRLIRDGAVLAETRRRFGFRSLRAQGEALLLNDQPYGVRGILSWGWNPHTLAPVATDDEIRDEFRRVRALGFNLVKLCLFVPPERLFEIADEEGMLLWLELPMWWQRINDYLRGQAPLEYRDILRRVHHHPSIVIYSLGCELGIDMADAALLGELNAIVRGGTTGVLACDNSGSGEAYAGLDFDFADFSDYHFYSDLHYFAPLLKHFYREWQQPRPWIFGEYCDSDDYRDPAELNAGGERPAWRDLLGVEGNTGRWAYSEQETRMAAHALPFSDAQLVTISRRESFLKRKFILERTRATGYVGGYVLTGLRDTPISTSGVFDDLGRSKFDPDAFRRFNDESVLLLEGRRARQWVNGGDRPAPVDLFNYVGGTTASFRLLLAHTSFAGGELRWRLVRPDGSSALMGSSSITAGSLHGRVSEIAALDLALPHIEAAQMWQLEADLDGDVANTWRLWLYPTPQQWGEGVTAYDPVGAFGGTFPPAAFLPDEVILASVWTPQVEAFVRGGGRAILLQTGDGAFPAQPVPFWRESIKLIEDHPLWHGFPHAGHVDLQFYHLAADHALDTTSLADARRVPILTRLDARLFTLLDYLVELEMGSGRLIASSLRFWGGAGDQVTGIQHSPAALFLLRQIVDYLSTRQ
ncbi:MAG: hypothetical protein IAE80_16155 [Anaerolinea sp.]|nr:hypothetical protein [Anaerolinea sp.]